MFLAYDVLCRAVPDPPKLQLIIDAASSTINQSKPCKCNQ